MARTVFIVGNDGSGKSTYARRLAARLEARGWRVRRTGYYDSLVRRCFRGLVEALTGASRRKLVPAPAGSPRDSGERPWATAGGLRRLGMLAFLSIYQAAMALEWRVRDGLATADVLLCERSFVDDLASVAEVLRVEAPAWLLRCSGRLFPVCRLCYLSAGHDVEYRRIVTLDLSPLVHQRKGERYRQWVRLLSDSGVKIRRIHTGRHPQPPETSA